MTVMDGAIMKRVRDTGQGPKAAACAKLVLSRALARYIRVKDHRNGI